MNHPDALLHTARALEGAVSYREVFGSLNGTDAYAKQRELIRQFRQLAMLVHPDQNPPTSQKKAEETFTALLALRRSAEQAIKDGTYDAPFNRGATHADTSTSLQTELRSARTLYRLESTAFATGDFSVLYRGKEESGEAIYAKISKAPVDNPWLEREAEILQRFRNAKNTDSLSGIARFLPSLLDTFVIEGEKGTRYRVNIISATPHLVSITDIMRAYPKGIDPRDGAWIYRRILAQTLAASMANTVHGGMVPDHVLVDPDSHEPLHIGWAHAIDDPQKTHKRITHILGRWEHYYPPEVFAKQPPTHQTDLFMAGKMMIELLGGNAKRNSLPPTVPKKVGEIILRSVELSPASRPKDGKQLLDDFTRVIRQEWGRGYRPLLMPVR